MISPSLKKLAGFQTQLKFLILPVWLTLPSWPDLHCIWPQHPLHHFWLHSGLFLFLLWHMFYSSFFVWHTPNGCEHQNGSCGLMFRLNAQWKSTANTFLTLPPAVWFLLNKPISVLGGCLSGLSIVCSTSREAQRSNDTQDLSVEPLT